MRMVWASGLREMLPQHHGWCGIVSENNDTFFSINVNNRLIGGVVAWERGADCWEKFPTCCRSLEIAFSSRAYHNCSHLV